LECFSAVGLSCSATTSDATTSGKAGLFGSTPGYLALRASDQLLNPQVIAMNEFDPIELGIVQSHMARGKCYFAAHLRYVTERDAARYKKQFADHLERLQVQSTGSQT
jgi:hypothetical protein